MIMFNDYGGEVGACRTRSMLLTIKLRFYRRRHAAYRGTPISENITENSVSKLFQAIAAVFIRDNRIVVEKCGKGMNLTKI